MPDLESSDESVELTEADIQMAVELVDAWLNNTKSWLSSSGVARYLLPKFLNEVQKGRKNEAIQEKKEDLRGAPR